MKRVLYIFGLFSDEDMNWLADSGRPERVSAGEYLVRAGESMDSLFLVLDGSFRVTLQNQSRAIATLTEGEVIGEISMLDSRPPTANVMAEIDGTVLVIKRADLTAKLDLDEAFASRFYHALATFLAQRLRATVATFGFGAGELNSLHVDEIDPQLFDTVSIAGARFVWLRERLAYSRVEYR